MNDFLMQRKSVGKLIVRSVLLIFSCLIFSQCVFSRSKREVACTRAINTTVVNAEKVLCKRYNMQPVGLGLMSMDNIVTAIDLNFYMQRPLQREEAIQIAVEAAGEVIRHANANKELRIFMRNYPFTYDNVGIGIRMCNEDGSSIKAPGICSVSCFLGKIWYYVEENGETVKYVYPETPEQFLTKRTIK